MRNFAIVLVGLFICSGFIVSSYAEEVPSGFPPMQQPPVPSEQDKAAMERGKKIGIILNAYYQGALSAQEAEQDLFPLIKQEIQQGELQGLDFQIQALEKQLEFLKKAKSDPDLLVKKRIDELLGRATPEGMPVPGER